MYSSRCSNLARPKRVKGLGQDRRWGYAVKSVVIRTKESESWEVFKASKLSGSREVVGCLAAILSDRGAGAQWEPGLPRHEIRENISQDFLSK
jgi:hypothetical protein